VNTTHPWPSNCQFEFVQRNLPRRTSIGRTRGITLPKSLSIDVLIEKIGAGDASAKVQLIEQLYPLLRGLAYRQFRASEKNITIRPTELAHEAYLRFGQSHSFQWKNKAECMAFLASVVRHVTVDYLRTRHADKRHGSKCILRFDQEIESELGYQEDHAFEWIRVDDALHQLEAELPECAKVVELKLFSDLNSEEIAQALHSSTATVGRHWRFAKAWLVQYLASSK
jgi:RNA polymerase sigma factor (TIGR02999 family)